MNIITDKTIPRKWEWVAEQLKKHDDTEALVEIAEQIDELMERIYGENTHTDAWVADMKIWKDNSHLITIMDLATKYRTCTACAYSQVNALGGLKIADCKTCEFAKEGGFCQSHHYNWIDNPPDPEPLFRQFIDKFHEYRYDETR